MTERQPNYPALNLPPCELDIIREGDSVKVYDKVRKKYVNLTPEEFVRQNFVNWLMTDLHYPLSHIANEITLDVNNTRKRCDTLIFSQEGTPIVVVEYKAPTVEITQDVFDQIFRYNLALKAKYLVVSNGLRHYCCRIDYENASYNFIPKIPSYEELHGSSILN